METLLRPTQHLRKVQALFPHLGREVDRMRAARGKTLPAWPDWCFLPLAGAAALVQAGQPAATAFPSHLVGTIGALAAWRATQGVYRLDADLFAALWGTPITGHLPTALLYHLPEWCVYVECPLPVPFFRQKDRDPNTTLLYGWFCHLEWDAKERHTELRLVLELAYLDEEAGLLPYALHVGDWDLEESIRASTRYAIRAAERYDVGAKLLAIADQSLDGARLMAHLLAPIVSVTLYLCSVSADISWHGGVPPTKPQPVRTKAGPRLFPPHQPHVWEVGFRVGAALRAGTRGNTSTDPLGKGSRHTPPRAHIRRSHWHLFWTGKGRTAPRVRWLHPMLVGGNTEALIPTIHPVNEEAL